MKKYFILQTKLSARFFPFVLGVTLALLVGLGVVLSGLLATFRSETGQKTYYVAITGDTDDQYLQWGLIALQTVDESNFAISIIEKTQEQAHSDLVSGKIHAYVVIPEGFMEKALNGEMGTITYVTSAGLEGLTSMLKREITGIVTDMVVYSQKGSYGMETAVKENLDVPQQELLDSMTAMSFGYTDLIFSRDDFYGIEELGLSDGLTTRDYYICAAILLVLLLSGIPYAALYIKRDLSLSRLLLSRGYPPAGQLLCEFGAHLLGMLALMLVLLLGATCLLPVLGGIGALPAFGSLLVRILPVVVMIAALNMLMFSLCTNMVSGLLLHFFCVVALGYLSGCIYPAESFPKGIQTFSAILPTSFARRHLATAFSGDPAAGSFLALIGFTLGFLALTLVLRTRRVTKVER